MFFTPMRLFFKLAEIGLSLMSPPSARARPSAPAAPSAAIAPSVPSAPSAPSGGATMQTAVAPTNETARPSEPTRATAAATTSENAPEHSSHAPVADAHPELAAMIVDAYEATIAALDPKVTDPDVCERSDARALEVAEAVRARIDAPNSIVPEAVRPEFATFVEHLDAAQLQIMAFAINRKNRGTADAAETEAERRDRDAFRRDVRPSYDALRRALGARLET